MPIYEYQCWKCRKDFDHLAKSMSHADEAVACPECGSKKTNRKISVFAVASGGSSKETQAEGMCRCGRAPGSCGMN